MGQGDPARPIRDKTWQRPPAPRLELFANAVAGIGWPLLAADSIGVINVPATLTVIVFVASILAIALAVWLAFRRNASASMSTRARLLIWLVVGACLIVTTARFAFDWVWRDFVF